MSVSFRGAEVCRGSVSHSAGALLPQGFSPDQELHAPCWLLPLHTTPVHLWPPCLPQAPVPEWTACRATQPRQRSARRLLWCLWVPERWLLWTAHTICFDWSPTGGSNGTVGVRFIAFEEAIIFLRVRLSSLLTKCPQMKRKVADWIITVGLFIRLGRCLSGLRPWFKGIFSGVYPTDNSIAWRHLYTCAPFSDLVRKRQGKCKEREAERADDDHI